MSEKQHLSQSEQSVNPVRVISLLWFYKRRSGYRPYKMLLNNYDNILCQEAEPH